MNFRSILDRLARLNANERRLLTLVGGVLGFVLFIGLPTGLEWAVHSRRADVDELRTALDAVQSARGQVRERQMRKDAIASRYAKKAPALAGFIEEKARAEKLEVTDTVDRPEIPHGKKFNERSTLIHLKKSGLGPISRFLEAIEKSGYPVAVTRLDLRKRSGEPDSYDVEVGISAYDRVEKAAKSDTSSNAPPGGSATP